MLSDDGFDFNYSEYIVGMRATSETQLEENLRIFSRIALADLDTLGGNLR